MRILVLTPVARAVQVDRLRDLFPGYMLMENTVSEAANVISITDIKHEGNIPERWPDRVISLGEIITRFKPQVTLPLAKAQALLEEYLKGETFEEEEVVEPGNV